MREEIRQKALVEGFGAVSFASAVPSQRDKANLGAFIKEGRHGSMAWMAETEERRADPQVLWPDARSAVVLGINYAPPSDSPSGLISHYARNRDYHDLIKKRLKRLGRWMAERYDCGVKVFVDTAPVMEVPLAARSSLGWQGKHTNLVSRKFGSWLFLGEVFTTLDLKPDPPEPNRCGSCSRCIEACPTGALSSEGQMDARLCLSYLTIEHKGPISAILMEKMGTWVYGCDLCTEACPWNRFAPPTKEEAFLPREGLGAPRLEELAELDEDSFRVFFQASPVKRIGFESFRRNLLIAMGNAGRKSLADKVRAGLDDASPTIRQTARWAVEKLT